ncbi:MAG: FecR family protein [Pseudobacter sp.]|uniref:FecR family protein n=1 Tax=Pseudobacter sp. TaxID=2045420 RepID=UPI003F803A56
METPQDRIVQLLERYSKRTATEAELTELTEWMANAADEAPFNSFVAELLEQQAAGQAKHSDPDWTIIYEKVRAGRPMPEEEIRAATPVRSIRKRWLAAASIAALLGTGAWLWSISSKEVAPPAQTAGITRIGPGQEGAILTLADGSTILLDSLGNGFVVNQSGVEVNLQNGELNYGKGRHSDALSYNSMSTPKGRQFRLQLPDGTRVWLNAASSIRYPVSFTGDTRRVDVTGEAYFEVVTDRNKPFLVNINNKAEVEVLGTSFNVNAYTDEPQLSTTLLNGRIRVSKANASEPASGKMLLQPGQQTQLKDGQLELITTPDISKVMAWKNGLFNFEGMGLKEMMRQLERWYDIEVEYEGNVPDVHFFGKMSRKLDLSTVLAALKGFGLHFRMEDRKLVIIP